MVANPRKAKGAGPLRPLADAGAAKYRAVGLPVPLEAVEDRWQRPVSIMLRGRRLRVESIDDLWQVDDEWWRESPISRRYYQITAEDARRMTIFRDQAQGGWYWQRG